MRKSNSLFVGISILFFASCENSNSRNKTLTSKYGDYSGEISCHLDTANGKSFALIGSSASQVYEGDNNFDCKLLMAENNLDNNGKNYNVFNLSEEIPLFCGTGTIKNLNDTTIELKILPNGNVGMCRSTIDFSESMVLHWKKSGKRLR